MSNSTKYYVWEQLARMHYSADHRTVEENLTFRFAHPNDCTKIPVNLLIYMTDMK